MTETIFVIAGETFFQAIQEYLTVVAPQFQLQAYDATIGCAVDGIILVHAESPENGMEALSPLQLAAALRRSGINGPHRGPIVVASSSLLEFSLPTGAEITGIRASLNKGTCHLPWFAPFYDEAAIVPGQEEMLVLALQKVSQSKGKRAALVEAAISRAWEDDLRQSGIQLDHQWRGVEAVLRFLRGAQSEWMIAAEDGQRIIEHIATSCFDSDSGMSKAVRNELVSILGHPDALEKQRRRWASYQTACEQQGKAPRAWREYGSEPLPYRLLLIDDDWHCLGWKDLLQCLLAPDGFEVIANDGQIGDDGRSLQEQLQDPNRTVDVVMLDLNLATLQDEPQTVGFDLSHPSFGKAKEKGLEGLELLDKVREWAPDVPVILFTGTESLWLERRRQELGIVGYVVKQENVEPQNARAYYKRLRELCRKAIDHEIRSILNGLVRDLEPLDPALYACVSRYLHSAVEELDDPLATCHEAGLVLEAALAHRFGANTEAMLTALPPGTKKPSEFSQNQKEFGKLYPAFSDWLTMGAKLRNITAHPSLGSASLEMLDAHWVTSLAVFVLYFLIDGGSAVKHRFFSPNETTVKRLLSLIQKRCLSELHRVAQQHDDVIQSLAPKGLMKRWKAVVASRDGEEDTTKNLALLNEEVLKLVTARIFYPTGSPSFGVEVDKDGYFTYLLPNTTCEANLKLISPELQDVQVEQEGWCVSGILSDTASKSKFVVEIDPTTKTKINCRVFRSNFSLLDSAKALESNFSQKGSGDYKIKPDYLHFGAAGTYFVCARQFEVGVAVRSDEKHLCLAMFSLTRLLLWSIKSAAGQFNPLHEVTLDNSRLWSLKFAPITPALTNKKLARFTCGVRASRTHEPCTPALVRWGENAIDDLARQYLLTPKKAVLHSDLKALENQKIGFDEVSAALATEINFLKGEKGKAQSQLQDYDRRLQSLQLSNTPHPSGSEEWREKLAHLQEAMNAQGKKKEEELRSEFEQLKREEASLNEKLSEKLLEEKVNSDVLQKLNEGIAESERLLGEAGNILTREIVTKFAPETLAELQLVRDCVARWSWTQQRHDLPDLISDLALRWQNMAS